LLIGLGIGKGNTRIELYWCGKDISMDMLSIHTHCTLETFIGPPWLERKMKVREFPVPVPIGTTSGLQEKTKVKDWFRTEKLLFLPEYLIITNF
jgi:predicted DNA-binding transcriptional regulator AlpA